MSHTFITDFREVDSALVEAVKGLTIAGTAVPVSIAFPDVDADGRDGPMFVISRLNEYFDASRWENDDLFSFDEGTQHFTKRKPPEPWNCIYAIQLLAPTQGVRNQMQMHLMRGVLSRGYYLPVKGQHYHVDVNDVWSGQMVTLIRGVEEPQESAEREITATYALTAKILIDLDPVGVTAPLTQEVNVDGDPNY